MLPIGTSNELVLEIEPDNTLSSNQDDSEKPPKIVNEGLWTVSAEGSRIRCREWRVLDTNFRFFLDGRILLGPGTFFYWIFIIVHLTATLTIFLVFEILPRINDESHYMYIIPVLAILLTVVSIISVLQVALTEPGFIPKPLSIAERKRNSLDYYIQKKHNEPDGLYQTLNGEEIWHTFCSTCHHFKPAGSKHCEECGGCIEGYDHHCSIFGICVGKRNYIPFLRFVLCTASLFIVVGTTSFIHLISQSLQSGFLDAVGKAPTILVLLLTLIIPPCGLCQVFWLVFRHLRALIKRKRRFDRGEAVVDSDQVQRNRKYLVIKGFENIYVWIICPPSRSRIHPREYKEVIAIPRVAEEKDKKARKARTVFSCTIQRDDETCQPPPSKKRRIFIPRFIQRVIDASASCTVPRFSERVVPIMYDEIESEEYV